MMQWDTYIEHLLETTTDFDGINLSLQNGELSTNIPPIIKASILMLDRMQKSQGKLNMFVFPEKTRSVFTFTLIKLIHNIAEQKIEHVYDPEAFIPGEKLKIGSAIVQFLGIEDHAGKKVIKIKLADPMEYSAPIEFFPFFQKTNTKKRINRYKYFHTQFMEIKKSRTAISQNNDTEILSMLANHKTHMDSSIMYMTTSVPKTKELMINCRLCGKKVNDVILVGQADYSGEIRNIFSGQLGGIPAIVLASDLYSIREAALNGHPIQSVIIDASNINSINSQLDALDDLIRLNVPITCVMDIVNSFEIECFSERNFNIWRWDNQSITSQVYSGSNSIIQKR